MIIKVKAKPSSAKQEVVKKSEDNFVVYLKSAPRNNKANIELVKLLHKYFNRPIKIKSGLSSRNKTVRVGND